MPRVCAGILAKSVVANPALTHARHTTCLRSATLPVRRTAPLHVSC